MLTYLIIGFAANNARFLSLAERCVLVLQRYILFYEKEDLEQLCRCSGEVFDVR